MLTRRTLKKKSKRALAVMQQHFPNAIWGEVFTAERGESYHGLVIRCTHGAGDPARIPGRRYCECVSHPLKGTPMIGAMSGYYEPEWSEKTAYEALSDVLMWTTRPDGMSDAAWASVLRIIGHTPASHAKYRAWLEAEMAKDAASPCDGVAP